MSRVVKGVVNKMDNGRKKFSKKVVRRAVRRDGKKFIAANGKEIVVEPGKFYSLLDGKVVG